MGSQTQTRGLVSLFSRVWSHPSGLRACEGRLAIPGLWAAEGWGQAGALGRPSAGRVDVVPGACVGAHAGPHLCGVERPSVFSFLTVAVTCLGNHLQLFIVNYKNKLLFSVVKSLYFAERLFCKTPTLKEAFPI